MSICIDGIFPISTFEPLMVLMWKERNFRGQKAGDLGIDGKGGGMVEKGEWMYA